MRNVSAVAALSGPIVLSGYVVGSAVATWTSSHRRRPAARNLADDAARPGLPVSDWILEAFAVLVLSTAAWWAIQEVSPGSNLSRIGYFSDQVLSAWQSVALWCGLATIAGLAAPIFHRFRGSTGVFAAAALTLVHFPWFFFASIAVGGVAMAFGRPNRSVQVASIAALLPMAWLSWVLTIESPWGLPGGPEATVWAMVLTVVLGVRWWADRHEPATDALF